MVEETDIENNFLYEENWRRGGAHFCVVVERSTDILAAHNMFCNRWEIHAHVYSGHPLFRSTIDEFLETVKDKKWPWVHGETGEIDWYYDETGAADGLNVTTTYNQPGDMKFMEQKINQEAKAEVFRDAMKLYDFLAKAV